ncbi:MAG: PepSY-associated TM helix domain-containing protein [Rhodocyclaceae bacterium]|nr:PepSY-associated TM helix domain-containing protein [Rhodocyclaceae bacterium]
MQVQHPPAGGSLLFMPRRFQRGKWIRWLKRTHAWMALWGGIAGTLFGLTGILLNHREVMKIPAVESRVEAVQLALAEPPASVEDFADYVQKTLQLGAATKVNKQAAKPVAWGEKGLVQPERWELVFVTPQRQINVEYWVGNSSASVQNRTGNGFFWLTRLHKATGVQAGWILAADALAGTLLFMTITGILLWSRLHGSRLLAVGILGGSLGVLGLFALLS